MIPSAFVTLTELPLTDNGKLDRNALPPPTATATGAGRPPRDDHEAVLCRLFAEFLDVPDVTVDDGFFALGGHSLLAARLAARIRQTLGISTTVREIFSHPTPAALATALSREERRPRPALTPRRRPSEQNA
jgi:nonribosomal peptide synthetase DhbF